ncbi:hypothetical protein D187_007006 [Cystobacter fuscus DSM 2262]|uniref:Uncharacterized protein n=1 Tax=Cystobacter fuscus (strain ATCC 25194 / DSM 2262 / NBRC 100088 / M29) TaxID=1242864 RepID=S9P4V3_CYSF2|nr:hypothetical protein [Cystobacter fuscus]EPX57252.1 hypothetical protein D187_007006 [Cystobacter fuscus DSM 2262]
MSEPARTYNQEHVPRKYVKGRRRVSVYISWSYPGEANRDVTEMDNRYSTMTEVRRVLWPEYESPRFADPSMFQQGITGSLELFFWAWVRFQQVIQETTGHGVPVFQRVDQAGFRLPLDERVLADADTLLVFGLDHMVTEQEASTEEIEAVRNFLEREGTCLIIGPHHDVGASPEMAERAMEYAHHGDALVPRQQRFGRYTRSLMRGLGIPVENRHGLRPAVMAGSRRIAPLTVMRELDTRGWLEGVTNFNFHQHLPHYAVTDGATEAIHVLARQPIDTSRPHPFTLAGNQEFNALVWMPPSGNRGGDVLVADSTVFSTLFGHDESLERFWRNLATAN